MKNHTATIYNQAARFAGITKAFIISGNIQRAKKCLDVAEKLFVSGSSETKTAISNVYLYSVTAFMEMHKCSIQNLFPTSLEAEYRSQINAIGA